MFFGLVLKANRKYTQTIKKAFHLSQAALDVTACGDEPVQLILISEKTSYILCTLRKKSVEQVPLDLNFAEGDEISFLSQGNGNVHLSGYLVDEDYLGEDEELDLAEALKENASKKQKKDKKKGKTSDDEDDDAEDDDDDDDDADDDDDGDLELEDSDEEAEDEEDEEEDDSGEDSEEEVKEPAPKKEKLEKPKQNGIEKLTKKDKKNKDQSQQQPQQQKQKGEKTLQGGVKVEDIKVGSGPEAKAGKKISVYYEGRLKSNNKVFDSTKQGNGFKFALGNGDVIKGWDIGVVGMKVGGKRRITCPPNAAYGAKGSPPVIPPNSTLVFEVELKGVH